MPKNSPTEIEAPDLSFMLPLRISVTKIKSMSDAELFSALNGEDGRKGVMTQQCIQMITSELQARSVERANKPHWSVTPSFWLLIVGTSAACIAAYYSYLAYSQPQSPVAVVPPSKQTIQPAIGTHTSSLPLSPSSTASPAVPQKK